MSVPERKREIVRRLCECFSNFNQVIVVKLDNVSTNQIHSARALLRNSASKGEMIIGKNTLIKKALEFMTKSPEKGHPFYDFHCQWKQNSKLEALIPLMTQNVGLIFSDESYIDLRDKVEAETIKMPARTGIIAPSSVVVPAGATGIEVGKIDLFHKLNISCKTVKSAIEVVKQVTIITEGEKVGEGATQLCKLLQIIPFEYKLQFNYVYMDGVILDKKVINMPGDEVLTKFKEMAGILTAASLGANIPNSLSVPHFLANGFKSLLAIGTETDYKFKQLDDALNAASNQVASGPVETKVEAKKEEAKVEEESEEEEDMDLGDLFG